MSIIGSNILAGASGQAGGAGAYEIERSVRFNSADSAYLSRTPASSSNRKTWTFAAWVKRARLGGTYTILGSRGTTPNEDDSFQFNFTSSDVLAFSYGNGTWKTTTQVFRDCSAWYHLTLAFDSTQATAANRIKLYVNGIQVTSFTVSSDTTLNLDSGINKAIEQRIGSYASAAPLTLDGYLADAHLIDGQALDPTSFGEFDTNSVWQPIDASGLTYGTNGFRLPFSDNSTAAALGTDTSGNGHTWTVNNISVTAGVGNDSLVDSPTNGSQVDTGVGGEVVGNYCTLNPLDKSSSLDLSNGNLTNIGTTTNVMCRSTIFVSSGKWYYEVSLATHSGNPIFGWASSSANLGSWVGNSTSSWGYAANATKYSNGGGSSYGSSYGAGDVIGVAADLDAGTLVFYKNGVSQGTAYSNLSGTICPAFSSGASTTVDFNFGQRPFAYTAPSGFKALCTTNLPEPTIADGSTVMDVKLYTGNGSTQTISGLNFSPDWVWLKARSNAGSYHKLYDTVRGATKLLNGTNDTLAESTETQGLTTFNSDGFSLGTEANHNASGITFVAWTWDAGSSTVTNTEGSITSQVRANASAGFSVVSWTGGAAGSTVGHGLNAAPELIIAKSRTYGAQPWVVYQKSLGKGGVLQLNATAANITSYSEYWGANEPSSSVFGTYTGSIPWANNYGDMISYCFAPVAGYSSFGSYTGNGSADGPFVFCNFRPAVVLVKMSSSTGNWTILDDKREGYNVDNDPLFPNLSNAEGTTDLIDITSNGFKVRTTDATFNTNAGTYVYAAWASSPFAYSRAR
jgi:hypothetical protein